MTGHANPGEPVRFIDNAGGDTVSNFMHDAVVGARHFFVCVGYVSEFGLKQLAAWLDVMAPGSTMLLLIGMAPNKWTFLASSSEAHAKYILGSMKYGTRASDLDFTLLTRLVAHQHSGRLQVRLRHPQGRIHAKLYLIRTQSGDWTGLAGSSNLSESGLTRCGEFNLMLAPDAARDVVDWFERNWLAQESVPANKVWQALLGMADHGPAPRHPRTVVQSGPTVHRKRESGKQGCWSQLSRLVLLWLGLMVLAVSLLQWT